MVVPAAIIGLLAVGSLTGALHGAVGGALLAAALGAVGAVVWRADAIPWRDIASWTIPLVAWVAVAWFALGSEALYLFAGAVAIVWLASFMFWLAPVRWWYRWVLRKDLPYGNRSRGAAQLHELDLAIGQAFQQYDRDADASVLHQRSERLLSRTVGLTIDDPGTSEARALLVLYLESLRSITADPWNQPPTAFEALNDQMQAFREALERLGGASA
jgi:hypothetical protein